MKEKIPGEEAAYQPARDIRGITVKTVLDALERSGSVDLPFVKRHAILTHFRG